MHNFDKEGFFKVIYICLISLFGATARQINSSIDEEKKDIKILIQKVFFHGFSGWLFGLAATKYLGLSDLTSITVCAGIGGLFGYDAIKVMVNIALNTISKSTDVNKNISDKKGE
ncbi:MAG: hypothetical protein N2749_00835 [Clostridia bacterium]|nr:hypothetical protein [Clostridia bacterium]